MSGHGGAAGKRAVQKSTVDRWIAESDKTLNTSVWLTYDTDRADRSRVVALKCSICARFRDRLVGRRNYSAAYIEGSVNLRASSYKEHTASETRFQYKCHVFMCCQSVTCIYSVVVHIISCAFTC